VTERLREKIAQISIPPSSAGGDSPPLYVAVSIGAASLHASRRNLTDLLAAADHTQA
jgi:PleD family two-component response regulator